MAKDAVEIEVPGPAGSRVVRLSSPDRVMWPEAGVTKRDLAAYVVAVGPALLRALADRPVTLQRFPQGVDGEAFYSKNPPRGLPEWVRTVPVTYPSGRSHHQIVIDETAAAVWAVQQNTVTFHPWPMRTADTDNPDELRIDLDPQPGRPYRDVVESAVALREVLREAGLTPMVKTSGSRGLHVYARVRPDHEILHVRHAVIAAARELERRLPELVTTAWWKEQRGDKVFVDFNQMARDRTIASAYSPRPLPHAPVSCPVEWSELADVDPRGLTVRWVPARLAERGDAWARMDDVAGDVAPLLQWWERDLADGLGEMPFPPDYPKMPGEPMRVQPSRARRLTSDDTG